MSTRPHDPNARQPPAPFEYAGKWVAWNQDETQVLASAQTFRELQQLVEKCGIFGPLYEKIPRADVRFLGGWTLNRRDATSMD